MKNRLSLAACLFLILIISINCFATPLKDNDTDITQKIAKIAAKNNSIVGVSAVHIETNQAISYNGNMPFYMASTIKIPIALTLLNRVDNRQESLDRHVYLNANDGVPGSGNLRGLLNKKATKISLRELLRLMLIKSDNTATDAVLDALQGTQQVQQRINQLGISQMYINRSILEMFVGAHGGNQSILQEPHTSKSIQAQIRRIPISQQISGWKIFENTTSDSTTANAMASLLAKIYKQQTLSATNTSLLLSIMRQCKTGNKRIKGLLPRGTIVAHKTGTWGINSNDWLKNPATKQLYRFNSDVGIITLPRGKGHIAIAVYVKSQAPDSSTRTRVIALISRQIYDYYMKNT